MSLGYDNIQIHPYELVELEQLTLMKKINEHTRLYFTGIIPEEMRDSYVEKTEKNTVIEVSQRDESGESKPLFSGIALTVEVKVVRNVYYLVVEAISHTYRMDIRQRTRSFQNTKMTIPQLLERIGEDYEGLDVIDGATGGEPIGRIAIQYQETDWAFLRRMASRYHTSLMPVARFDSPKFYFGIEDSPAHVVLDHSRYSVRKQMLPFRYFQENEQVQVDENDFIVYEVETDEVLDLGAQLAFQGHNLFVIEAYTEMKSGLLRHQYVLTSYKGLRQKRYFQEKLAGASLGGVVLDVRQDQVRIHLDCDEKQAVDQAHWFNYSTVYSGGEHAGWYVMPEKGDPVSLYFPGSREEDGVAGSAVRRAGRGSGHNKFSDPQMKIWRTPHGKEIRLGPDELVVTGKDGAIFIKLDDKEGIHIVSSKQVNISAGGNLSLSAGKKMSLSAGSELRMECKGSHIQLSGSADMKGAEVKSN
ncbi:contractile injection system protein, VgrG/Pvc8 family [Paenibacillus sp. VCA1]|uniref:contractile injection system protein, VgrG/Pvc8 family n=1 Tax=Paenibacillus sp. VCA1 TaxID=3039148 RepID=UPI0028722A2E|nr:contractile injection system protein, VgrG/Pvc8 family [Paenibacillus sp. VCA1]MDR9855913.1 contractile injection system protein, VgrG/Pvc8 family [Paenibacillus sp. VCA1]